MIKIINSKLIELILENKSIFIINLLIFNILFYLFYIHDINKKNYLLFTEYSNLKTFFEVNEGKLSDQIISLANKNNFIELKDYDQNIARFSYILKNENDLNKAEVAIKNLFNKILEEEIFNKEVISTLNSSTLKLSEKKLKQDLNDLKDEYLKDINLAIQSPSYLKELSFKFDSIIGGRFYFSHVDEIEKLELEKDNLFYLNFYQNFNQISIQIKNLKNEIGNNNEKIAYLKGAYEIFNKQPDKFVNISILNKESFINQNIKSILLIINFSSLFLSFLIILIIRLEKNN